MKINILTVSGLLAFALNFSGCAENDFNEPANTCVETTWVKTKEVQDIVALATLTGSTPTKYIADDVIEAYVTSNDERGNFYKTVHLQTLPTTAIPNPVGIVLSLDKEGLFGKRFTPGKKVTINLNGMYYAIVDGSLKLGSLFELTQVGRVAERDIDKFVFPACDIKVPESDLVRTMPISTAITNANLNTLIELDNVEFADASLGRTLYDVDSGGGATNHDIVDITTGVRTILRVSSFAGFAGQKVPSGSGKIRGVLTKFGSTFQFMVRDFSDFKLTSPRPFNFTGTQTENFESYSTASTNQPMLTKYLNLPVVGTKSWLVKTSSGFTKYLEMTSFSTNTTPEKSRSLFLVPVDFTAASTLAFQIRTQFYNGSCFKVYYTTNYVPGEKISSATLYDISSSFAIPTANTTPFVNAGTYNIPANVTGNGFFVFEYVGSNLTSAPVVTTTIQLDNITIN